MTDQQNVPPVQAPTQGVPHIQDPTQGYWAVVPKKKGFIPSLFDMSFDNLITPTLLRFVFVIAVIAETLISAIIMILSYGAAVGTTDEFGNTTGASPMWMLAGTLFAALFWVLGILGTRVFVESVIVRFKSNEYLHQLATKSKP